MALWICKEHGIYGGQVFCPKCGKNGAFATFEPERPEGKKKDRYVNSLGPSEKPS